MSDAQATREYILGNTRQEQERLKLQASIIGGWTEHYLRSAGLEQGMHVLDLGTGMGDVALLAATIVGPSGSVVGIDRDHVTVEMARQRLPLNKMSAPVEFIQSALADFKATRAFDAVIGRYFLLYQPDPVEAVRHAMGLLRQDGILCFHEVCFGSPIKGYPEDSLFEKMLSLIGTTFRRMGINPDTGFLLAQIFMDAALPRPTIKGDVPVGGEAGSYLYDWGAQTVKALLPRIEQLGLASAQELQVETLAQRMIDEAVQHGSQLIGPLQFGGWTRKP